MPRRNSNAPFHPLVGTIDIGTTSARAILFNANGEEIAKHQIEYSTSASEAPDESQNTDQFRRRSSLMRHNQPIFTAEGVAISINDDIEIENNQASVGPTLRFPQPGWVECMPVHILANAVQCLIACLITLRKINQNPNLKTKYKVKCIGIANMRETTIVWSRKTGKPLSNGIVWTDTRTSEIVQHLERMTDDERKHELKEKTGLPLSTYFSAAKLRWLIDNDEIIKEEYEKGDGNLMFGTVDTWLIYHLTKERNFVTDISNASRTYFMDIESGDYDDELLDFWGIDPEKIRLPKIVSSSEHYGSFASPNFSHLGFHNKITPEAYEILRTINGVPICGCLGDQSASLVGQLAFESGSAKCTYGTGCFLLYNTGTKKLISQHGTLTTIGYWFPGLKGDDSKPHFALEGSIAVAGSIIQWLRDNLKLIENAKDIGPLASQVPNSGGVVFIPAFSGLYAPYWNGGARGTIFGMTQYTSSSHIARAALEGVCFQVRAILRAMASDAGASEDFLEKALSSQNEDKPLSSLAVDGGMSKADEVLQIQADILGPCVTVKRAAISECTALGAAIAAGLSFEDESERVWKDLDDVREKIGNGSGENNLFKAKLPDEDRRKFWKRWEKAVSRAKDWLDDDKE
ncbi:Glycerol kinase [Yamadazyma tenuis]|uniref:glycerol kinase n=1 Tax=Candida tenuis (strain ATCC 10573 / BCRC 21748 / CBS 615 / JCM 9827 / NBRC 10315 / NRRL Y-1498 / VKM Y-70) TaxID=590646 RepID=G3BDE6_CANTC|nr:glycerol kinase [Yamadazyma tenuis ATCC 10573]EGV60937.1 glycerol kinase [Yamadazyma tenuis ATCC 10573]WEJ93783.1 Glycerol kinase [Yamadazyma tenuis]